MVDIKKLLYDEMAVCLTVSSVYLTLVIFTQFNIVSVLFGSFLYVGFFFKYLPYVDKVAYKRRLEPVTDRANDLVISLDGELREVACLSRFLPKTKGETSKDLLSRFAEAENLAGQVIDANGELIHSHPEPATHSSRYSSMVLEPGNKAKALLEDLKKDFKKLEGNS